MTTPHRPDEPHRPRLRSGSNQQPIEQRETFTIAAIARPDHEI